MGLHNIDDLNTIESLKKQLKVQRDLNAELYDAIEYHRETAVRGRQAQANDELWELLTL